ncbi:hypothetical protein EDB85DRAFT_2164264 [Lactarius pseudohatsudake]|nr:hypothetical protein EDB85DRAFT_2164264 [Lactarius pseudohatsudake]
MSVASGGSADNIGFKKVYARVYDFLQKFWPHSQRCHVFLTDTEDKANLLRRQKLTEIQEKMEIYVYSAFVNIEELDSIMTKERVEELDNDMRATHRSSDTPHPARFSETVTKALATSQSFNVQLRTGRTPSGISGVGLLEKDRRAIDVDEPSEELVKKVIESKAGSGDI